MDNPSRYAIKFAEALGACWRQFLELTIHLKSRPEVDHAEYKLECVAYIAQNMVEGYVEATLRNGKTIGWLLDVCWDDKQWLISPNIALNDHLPDSTQKSLKDFPERTAETLDELVKQLLQATTELFSDPDSFVDALAA